MKFYQVKHNVLKEELFFKFCLLVVLFCFVDLGTDDGRKLDQREYLHTPYSLGSDPALEKVSPFTRRLLSICELSIYDNSYIDNSTYLYSIYQRV